MSKKLLGITTGKGFYESVPNAENVTKKINDTDIVDIFENDGTTSKRATVVRTNSGSNEIDTLGLYAITIMKYNEGTWNDTTFIVGIDRVPYEDNPQEIHVITAFQCVSKSNSQTYAISITANSPFSAGNTVKDVSYKIVDESRQDVSSNFEVRIRKIAAFGSASG